MAFVPSYRHDIFVSYAHVDDLPFPGVDKGWVTTLVETLEILLAQKLGRREAYSLWMDRELSRHAQLTPEILSHLGETATLLVILSPGYLASEWCLREKDTFLETVARKYDEGSRVFLIERDAVDFDHRPEAFRDLLGYRFWVQDGQGQPPKILGSPWPDPKNPENMAYFDQLTRLSCNLADELVQLREATPADTPAAAAEAGSDAADVATDAATDAAAGASAGATAPAEEAPPPTVYLAEVTDDLETRGDETRRYLEQADLRVLPDTWYPRDPDAFRQRVRADLEKSTLFLQLLSALPGKRPPTLPQGYLRLQHEIALEVGIPIIQWRGRGLDPATVEDPEHRAFLELPTVMAVGAEELKRTVVEKVRKIVDQQAAAEASSASDAAAPEDALVFLAADAEDIELAGAIGEALESRGIDYVLPLRDGSAAEVRADLEQNLEICDGVIIVYGTIHAKWVRDQMLLLRKLAWKRDQPLRAIAVFEGPPFPKDPVRSVVPKLITIDGSEGREAIDAETLEPFIAALAADS